MGNITKQRNLIKLSFFVIFIFSLCFISAAAIGEDIHLNIQTLYDNGTARTGTFAFVFNITDDSACSNIIYSNSTTLTTDARGIISYYLPNVSLDYDIQYYLCYYRDGVLINASKITRTPYTFMARNTTLSGVDVDTNFNATGYNVTANYGFFSFLGSLVNRITTLFTQNIQFNGTINGSGNLTTTGRIGIGTENPTEALDVAGNILATGPFETTGNEIIYAGSTLGQVKFFRPATTNDIALYAGGAERVRINGSQGNFGINTTTPQNTLNVFGDGNFTGNLYLSNASFNGGWQNGGITVSNGDLYAQTIYVYNISSLNVTKQNLSILDDLRAYGNAQIDKNLTVDTNTLFVNSDMNMVGIGTTNPLALLDVNGKMKLGDDVMTAQEGMLRFTGTSFEGYVNGTWVLLANASSNNDSSVWVENGSTIYYTGGNVGIGTTIPGYTLDVNGNIKGNAIYLGTGANYVGRFVESGTGYLSLDTYNGVNFTSNNLYLRGDNVSIHTGSGPTQVLTVLNTGNVGIGTTIPAAKLDVWGGAYIGTGAGEQLVLRNASDFVIRSTDNIGTFNQYMDGSVGYVRIDNAGIGDGNLNINSVLYVQGSSGNVGIGTTTPQLGLHVEKDNGNGWATLFRQNSSTAGLLIGTIDTNNVKIAGIDSTLGVYKNINLNPYGGNVGIGTTAPFQKLDIVGGVLRIGTTEGDYAGAKLNYTDGGTGTLANYIGRYGGIWTWGSGSATGDKIHMTLNGGGDSASTSLGLSRGSDGVTYVKLNANGDSYFTGGNVGIGTTTPQSALQIGALDGGVTAPSTTLSLVNTTGQAGLVFSSYISGFTSPQNVGGIFAESAAGWSSKLHFMTNNNWGNPTVEAMTIWGSNVGIGTTSPAQKLHVLNPTSGNVTLVIQEAGGTVGDEAKIDFVVSSATPSDSAPNGARIGVIRQGTNSVSDMYFSTNNPSGVLLERMRIQNSTGNVGIGTATPQNKLNVAGNINATGTIYAQNTKNLSIGYDYATNGSLGGGSVWSISGSDIYYNDGNVGVGTASPSSKLDILGNDINTPLIAITSPASFNADYWQVNDSSGNTLMSIDKWGSFLSSGWVGGAYLYSSGGGYYLGDVGIQTTTPQNELNVIGDINATGTLYGSLNCAYIFGGSDPDFCTDAEGGGGSSQWTTSGSDIYYNDGNVGIGTASPASKLSVGGAGYANTGVYGSALSYGVRGNGSSYGVYGTGTSAGVYGSGTSYGVYGAGTSYGVYGDGSYGVYGSGANTGVYGSGTSYGVQGSGYNGVYGSGTNYGVFGQGGSSAGVGGSGSTGVQGLGSTYGVYGGGTYGFYGNGNVYDFYAAGPGTDYGTSSSIRWKDNITEINPQLALGKILQIKGSYFNWNIYNDTNNTHDMGFIAEQIGPIVPEVVQYETNISNSSNWYVDENGIKKLYATGVDYGALTPLLVQAMKGQQDLIISQNNTINQQNQIINSINDRLNKICSKNPSLC